MSKTKTSVFFAALAIGMLLASGCRHDPDEPAAVTGIRLQTMPDNSSGGKVSYIWLNDSDKNNPVSLVVVHTIEPSNAANKNVTWKITGNENGYIDWNDSFKAAIAKKAGGPVTFTVTTEDGGFSASHSVRVLAAGESIPAPR